MDIWVVAAAAGAKYIAKNSPNFSVDKNETPGGPSLKYPYNLQPESRNFLQQLRDKTCPLRRLTQKTVQDDTFLDLEDKGSVSGFSGESQQLGDGESKNLSRINGGKMGRSRRCRARSTRPLSSSMSCGDLEHLSCLYQSMSAVRPVLVTDAMSEETKRDNKSSSPSLKQLKSFEVFKKPDKRSGSLQQSSSKGAEAALLFIAGMTLGILTASTSWKNEVDKLNMELNQMQNLVQDLDEELDMKETLMVKELDDESESDPPTGEEDTPPSMEEPISSLPKLDEFNGVKENDKTAENQELLSRIEAELEAELEVLEQNIKTSELERISDVVELDPDLEPEIVRGDLKATMVKDDTSESGSRTTGTMSDCSKPANYAVSPWELSLRLHELIKSRLEMRIKELEIALSQSENRVGVQHSIVSGRRFSYSGTESSSANHSPTCICDEHDKREDEPASWSNFSNNGESGCKVVDQGTRSTNTTQNGDYDFISQQGGITGEDRSPNLVKDMQRMMSLMSNEESMSEDESGDESELLLIKQIIERRKSGSSFNLKLIEMQNSEANWY